MCLRWNPHYVMSLASRAFFLGRPVCARWVSSSHVRPKSRFAQSPACQSSVPTCDLVCYDYTLRSSHPIMTCLLGDTDISPLQSAYAVVVVVVVDSKASSRTIPIKQSQSLNYPIIIQDQPTDYPSICRAFARALQVRTPTSTLLHRADAGSVPSAALDVPENAANSQEKKLLEKSPWPLPSSHARRRPCVLLPPRLD